MMYEFVLDDGSKLVAMIGSFYLKESTEGKLTVFLGHDAYAVKGTLNDFKYNISKMPPPPMSPSLR